MSTPSIPATHRDLLEAKVATFATVGPDGRPQLSEVWFLAEGDTVRHLRLHDRPGQSRVMVTLQIRKVHAADMAA